MIKVDELVFSYRTRATDYRKQNIMIKRKDLSLKPAEQLELAESLIAWFIQTMMIRSSSILLITTKHLKNRSNISIGHQWHCFSYYH